MKFITTPEILLLIAFAASGLISLLKSGPAVRLWPVLLGTCTTLAVVTLVLAAWYPPGMSYTKAENTRVILGAKETIDRTLFGSDCVIVLDGSSCSACGLDTEVMAQVFQIAGHKPCIVSLVNHGGEHLEREWMGAELRRLLNDKQKHRIDRLPTLWAKELLWLYDTLPARFAAKNRGSNRMLAAAGPREGARALRALVTDWRDAAAAARWTTQEAITEFPLDRVSATVHHTLFNLFACGRLNRLMDGPATPLFPLADVSRMPEHSLERPWWSKVPAPGTVEKPSSTLRPREWLKDILDEPPEGWTSHKKLRRVVFVPPVLNRTMIKYSSLLEREGLGVRVQLINGQADADLMKRLHQPDLWRDTLHLDADGAAIFSRWLATQMLPRLNALKRVTAKPGP